MKLFSAMCIVTAALLLTACATPRGTETSAAETARNVQMSFGPSCAAEGYYRVCTQNGARADQKVCTCANPRHSPLLRSLISDR